MKKQTITIAGIIGLILVSVGGIYILGKWRASQPTKGNFDKVVRVLWENNNPRSSNVFGDTISPLCISVPLYPTPDARSKAQQPLAWHIDFLLDPSLSKDREKQLQQLDVLSKVGLLEKTKATVNFTNETKEVTRYSLIEKGWSASGYRGGQICFTYGIQRYLGISRFESKVANNQTGLEIYEVYAKVGLSSETDLAPWARDPDVQVVFPKIREYIEGQEFGVLLVRGAGGWVDYQTILRNIFQRNEDAKLVKQTEFKSPQLSAGIKRAIAQLNALPTPSIDEVKQLLQKTHGVGQKNPWPIPCIYLQAATSCL